METSRERKKPFSSESFWRIECRRGRKETIHVHTIKEMFCALDIWKAQLENCHCLLASIQLRSTKKRKKRSQERDQTKVWKSIEGKTENILQEKCH
jgi:hypothetical protein